MRLAWVFLVAACHHGEAAPPWPTCTAAAGHVHTLIRPPSARADRIRDVFAVRCSADAWSDEVRACILATTSLHAPRRCKAKLTAAQRAALDQDLAALPTAPHATRVPEACNAYRALIERLGACAAISPEVRVAFEQGYRELARAWASGTQDVPALEVQCRLLASSVRHAATLTCGW